MAMKPLLPNQTDLLESGRQKLSKEPRSLEKRFLGALLIMGALFTGAFAGLPGFAPVLFSPIHAQTPIPVDELGPPPPPVAPTSGSAAIAFESLSHDWGTVLQGTVVEHTYKFRNVGTDVLRITNVKPG